MPDVQLEVPPGGKVKLRRSRVGRARREAGGNESSRRRRRRCRHDVLVATALVSPGLAVRPSSSPCAGLLAVTLLLLKVTLCAASWKSAAVGLPEPAVRVSVPVVAL